MIGACIILLWTSWSLAWNTVKVPNQKTSTLHSHEKRDTVHSTSRSQGWYTIEPIIPGVTVPFSDLPIMFCAVFTSQLIHELGHAVAAAIENVPIQSIGASLTLIVPSASVTFMAGTLDNKTPRTRSVIVSAGPFHNLVFWVFLSLLTKTNLDRFFWQFAYRDVTHLGRVVVHVDQNSILSSYLDAGTLITHVDDTPLASANVFENGWTVPPQDKEPEGWCVERTTLLESQICCWRVMSEFSPLTCFKAIEATSPLHGCLDPLPILTIPNSTRCSVASPCAVSHVCSWPDEREQLLRLTIGDPASKQDIILWSGPPDEIEDTGEPGEIFGSRNHLIFPSYAWDASTSVLFSIVPPASVYEIFKIPFPRNAFSLFLQPSPNSLIGRTPSFGYFPEHYI
ncbi:hypothetical protein AX14_012846 [Amanita brunnescens Koide BX004]|nr:hypothetical protein AX14_012846 [Amanita brunnescens Koide BX004]